MECKVCSAPAIRSVRIMGVTINGVEHSKAHEEWYCKEHYLFSGLETIWKLVEQERLELVPNHSE